MKRFLSFVLSAVMLIACMATVSAEEIVDSTIVKGYIQIDGVQMDSHGDVVGRPTNLYTGVVAESELKEKLRRYFTAVISTDTGVTEADVLAPIDPVPEDAQVLKNVIKDYYHRGYIKSNEGEVIPWAKMTTESYEVQWYVLKYEPYDDIWHLDGRIIDLHTDKNIEVVVPDDPADIPPEAYEDIDDVVDDPDVPIPTKEPRIPEYNPPYSLENDYAYIFGRNDKLMQPEDSMKRGEAAAVIYRLLKQNNMLGGFVYDVDSTPVFSDTKGRWDRSALEYMHYIGVYPASEVIGPTGNVKRGEAFKLMALALGFTSDTSLTDEEYAYILNNGGYIEGDENGDLMLDKVITRAEYCKIYNEIIERDTKLLVTADGVTVTPETYGFTDISESAWYYEDVLKATSAFDGDYVDLEKRGIRNVLDDYS